MWSRFAINVYFVVVGKNPVFIYILKNVGHGAKCVIQLLGNHKQWILGRGVLTIHISQYMTILTSFHNCQSLIMNIGGGGGFTIHMAQCMPIQNSYYNCQSWIVEGGGGGGRIHISQCTYILPERTKQLHYWGTLRLSLYCRGLPYNNSNNLFGTFEDFTSIRVVGLHLLCHKWLCPLKVR